MKSLHGIADKEDSSTNNPQNKLNVHFNPETIGCQLNTGRKIAKTRLTRGIPTTRIPAIYSTMADKGDVGNTKSIAGNQRHQRCTTTNSNCNSGKEQSHKYNTENKQYRTANDSHNQSDKSSGTNRQSLTTYHRSFA